MEPFHWLPALPPNFTPSIWPVMNGGGGCVCVCVTEVVGCVWRGVSYVLRHHHPRHTHTHTLSHPPNHRWCDKNFTSSRNFIYSVDIRLWLKTIKKRERWSHHALNSICKSNPGHLSCERGGLPGWHRCCHENIAWNKTSWLKSV